MTISSMTGFARSEGFHEGTAWTWEVRSVNARNLDTRLRLPAGYEELEVAVRAAVAERFMRGNLTVTLTITQSGGAGSVRVNQDVLDRVVALAATLQERFGAPPRPDGLLALRGVLETGDPLTDDAVREARLEAMSASLGQALDRLLEVRRAEGGRLLTTIRGHLSEIERLTGNGVESAAAQPEAIRARLQQQLEELLAGTNGLASDRLEQEVALLASRSDVREELDRLAAHVHAADDLLSGDRPVGRRLDFLCQEFNREANTLCSKSSDLALTRIGLDLKAAIDRLREQIQNIE